ncbi:cyclophilin-like protein [Martensiomyces pterosporus]|nr:cyclophilin-like protein [Martensiomyces pterosporus]
MSVLVETSIGDIVIDLHTRDAPRTCTNFLKLCKSKYYNFTPFHRIERNFIAQTGDPTGTGEGGESVYGLLGKARYFPAEVHPQLKHTRRGTVSMAVSSGSGKSGGMSGSQFFVTLTDHLDYLDGKYTVFGEVAEGLDVLDKLNDAICDEHHRPLRDIRIQHTIVLDDPFPDPPGLVAPDRSPQPTREQLAQMRIEEEDDYMDSSAAAAEGDPEREEKERREREARAQALTLEMIGDLPFAEIKPPENILFVCKLNPATRDDDLQTIFARFGQINSCEVIRDKVTGDSLGYAFVEFEDKSACEEAYFKMDNVLIDDRRIHVDFSQSVSKLHGSWVRSRVKRGVAGARGLQMRRRYRDGAEGGGRSFDMVFDPQARVEASSEDSRGRSGERHRSRHAGKQSSGSSDRYSRHSHHRSRARSRTRSRSPRRSPHGSRGSRGHHESRDRHESRHR